MLAKLKSVLKTCIVELLSWLIYGYIRLAYFTTRWQIEGFEELKAKLENKEPVIIAFWHGRIAMTSNFAPNRGNIHCVISRHGDGELLARILTHFGLQTIRGSSNRPSTHKKGAKDRGGSEALRETLRAHKKGGSLCITPDGPKGPRMHVVSAIAEIASLTSAPVYAIAFSTRHGRFIQSWDRFLFPLPFDSGVFRCAPAITVSKDRDPENTQKARNEIENQLNNITKAADIAAKREPIEPAPPS